MAGTHRLTTAALIVCLVGGPWVGTLFASEQEPSPREAPTSQLGNVSDPSSTLERSPFALTDWRITADAPVEAAGSAQIWQRPVNFMPSESSAFAQRGGYGGRRGRNGAATAIILGAAASIAGTAILVYANRPDCSTNQMASGCGYGTKVVGGAVLSAGIVSVIFGALTWR
jgi:hypothetical protein